MNAEEAKLYYIPTKECKYSLIQSCILWVVSFSGKNFRNMGADLLHASEIVKFISLTEWDVFSVM